MRLFRRKRWFILLLIGFLGILFFNSTFIGKWLYPIYYKDEIRSNANAYGVDPFLIAAIVRVESKFQTGTTSKKGAIGLMQLMPDTAEWVLEKGDFANHTIDQIHEPHVNIQMGTWYLGWLSKQFNGNTVAVMAAYNAGQGNVNKWITSGRWDGTYEHINSIPFGETRHYVQRVMYYYHKYDKIYSNVWDRAQ